MNKFFGVGYLVADLEPRQVGDKTVCNGAIAINRKYADDKTDFINISIWGKSAEIALKYTSKGSLLAIVGELQIEKKNDKVYSRINVEDFKFMNNKAKIEKEEAPKVNGYQMNDDDEIDFDEMFKPKSDLPF